MSIKLIICIVLAAVAFFVLWQQGYLVRLKQYMDETWAEVGPNGKCSWPTWAELKGSTMVVFISMALLGGFTVLADACFLSLVNLITPGK
ncbi:MAG TPA: preprotein translocase subunit SecE [Verrucomicrobiae bacterium]|nr:preprotein translocase subunit SecE [Verrucomicrobiae bacterium]